MRLFGILNRGSVVTRSASNPQFQIWSAFSAFAIGLALACGSGTPTSAPPPLPVINSLVAAKNTISTGQGTTLSAVFSNGRGMIDHGVGEIRSGIPIEVRPANTTTFLLTVTNDASATATLSVQVTVVPLPDITEFSLAASVLPIGGSTALRATYRGGTGMISPGDFPIPNGGTVNVAPVSTTTYTLTVTNPAGDRITGSTTLNIDTSPVKIEQFYSGNPIVDFGGSTSLNWGISGLPLTLTLNGESVLGLGSTQVSPVRRSTYTLYAANQGGTDSKPISVAARGVDLLAGNLNGGGFRNGHRTTSLFNSPAGITIAPNGHLLVSDTFNSVIRNITEDGQVGTFLGHPGYGLSVEGPQPLALIQSPTGICADKLGNIYVIDSSSLSMPSYSGGTIYKISSSGFMKALALIPTPKSLTSDPSGNILATGGHAIFKIAPNGMTTLLAGSHDQYGTEDGPSADARFQSPSGLVFDNAGNLFVADTGNRTVRKISPDGVVSTFAGMPGQEGTLDGTGPSARFIFPMGLAIDKNGVLFLVDLGGAVRKITPSRVVTSVAGLAMTTGSADGEGAAARFNNPSGIAINASGSLFIADTQNHTIREISPDGKVVTYAGTARPEAPGAIDGIGPVARFQNPEGVAADSAGNVYVASNMAIRKITPDGQVSTIVRDVEDGGVVENFLPTGLAVDAANNLYVAEASNHVIRKISTDGTVRIVAGAIGQPGTADGFGSAARFNEPFDVAVDSFGNLYVADRMNCSIRKISQDGFVSTLAGVSGLRGTEDGLGSTARFWFPHCLAVDKLGTIYVSDTWANTVRRVTSGGVVTTLAGSPSEWPDQIDGNGLGARFGLPTGLAVDNSGNIFVADRGNSLIRKISPSGVVTTVAGSRTEAVASVGRLPSALYQPLRITVTPAGDLVVTMKHGLIQVTAP